MKKSMSLENTKQPMTQGQLALDFLRYDIRIL